MHIPFAAITGTLSQFIRRNFRETSENISYNIDISRNREYEKERSIAEYVFFSFLAFLSTKIQLRLQH